MNCEDGQTPSPIIAIYQALRSMHPKWDVEIGQPRGRGWIPGTALVTAEEGPFQALLARMGAKLRTADRRTIAAAFALRYGWSSGIAIAPYLFYRCVPKLTLDNVALKFHHNTLFERAAVLRPEGVMLSQDGVASHPSIQVLSNPQALLRWLRESLVQQATPIVEALYEWSHFARRGIWGMITSSWAAQFMTIYSEIDAPQKGLSAVQQLFAGRDVVAEMQPYCYLVTYQHVTHVYHRRASCCRYYKLPQGSYCASCPLISQEERLERNRAWMQRLVELPPTSTSVRNR